MTVQEIANQLVDYCRKGDYQTCYKELYSPEIQSIEADGTISKGFDEIAAKGKEWNARIKEFHSSTIGDPIVNGNFFSLPMSMNITYEGAPGPAQFDEICVYEVTDGKIVKEQFFYKPS